ncbi:hypothetical protein ABFS82_13G087600 [Erythranthe guttata]|uniref:Probable purine permease n=1 Tax=Erythranthe guttata TaxID=4155 RepID=A0A022QKR9_ERYGU|nr:PREDICTED: probable purine permease 10 [Erythranthe guttata]EYU28179.1 hypothetical protein MIMGU_mgv1a007969mg [Erythranthe guttata]|eukprot:XP_012849077.1 PREDICTED: probable purine permease 10 [Erythranthe guttata]
MGEAQHLPSEINGPKTEAAISPNNNTTSSSSSPSFIQYKWWIQMLIYAFFVIAGQSAGTLLGRLYFDKGGSSKWLATLVQVVGFPVLLPFQLLNKNNHITTGTSTTPPPKKPFPYALVGFYITIGVFLAADCMLYSIGLQYLPVTTYTLICATQLGFNAVFSFFLNKQKFTPYIFNSLVLLTISSVLLVFQTDTGDSNKASKSKFTIGFLCTLAASAGYALMLSLTQLAFQRIIKKETLRAVVDLTVYQSLVATCAILIGLFASGDWGKLSAEMEGYKSGRVSYVMNLFWTAVSWQVFSVGCTGLIFQVSSLFSNVISILGLPVAPVLAVIFLRDKLTGVKAVAMLLAIWGFVSYMYQHYIDDLKIKEENKRFCDDDDDEHVSEVGLVN